MNKFTVILDNKLTLQTSKARLTDAYQGLVHATIIQRTWIAGKKEFQLSLSLYTTPADELGRGMWTCFPTLKPAYLHLTIEEVVEMVKRKAKLCFKYDKGPNGMMDSEWNKFITQVKGIPFCWDSQLWSTCIPIREYIAYVP